MKKLKIDAVLFIIIISVLGVANLLCVNKPEISKLENRALKSKPAFSIAGLFSGSYLRGFEEYYSDTFIMRDRLVKANRDIRHATEFLGPDVSLITAYEEVCVPENNSVESPDRATEAIPRDDMGKVSDGGVDAAGGNLSFEEEGAPVGDTDATVEESSAGAEGLPDEEVEETTAGERDDDTPIQNVEETRDFGDGQNVGYWLVVDGKAVQLFKFRKENFDYYSQVLNKYNEKLGDNVKIYSMIPPTASEFIQLKRYEGITDSQNDALGYLESRLDKDIISVNAYDALNEHKDEYIFFRTDHHWTALGAYYAYAAFMETVGIQPVALEQYEAMDLGDYLGSSYTKTLDKSLEKNPDDFIAYKPFTEYEYFIRYEKEEVYADVIDMKYADDTTNKYLSFISAGGGIWSVIRTEVDNGKKILVVKDSFGNALVPFLLPHYEEIYVVDARFYSRYVTGKNIVEFVEANEITEVLFVIYMEDVNWHDFMNWVENLLG